MLVIFTSELLRYRKLSLVGAIAMLFLLIFVHRVNDTGLLQIDQGTLLTWLVVISISSFSLGFWQMKSYYSTGLWTYLVHRPISHANSFIALASASIATLSIILLLPPLLILGAVSLSDHHAVETRHFLALPYLLGVVISFYTIGVTVALRTQKIVIFCLLVPLLFLTRFSLGNWIFGLEFIITLWLGVIAVNSFKPDLSSQSSSVLNTIFTNIAVQAGLFSVLVFTVMVGYQTGYFIWVGHPSTNAKSGNYFEFTQKFSDAKRISDGLSKTDLHAGNYLEQQLELTKVHTVWLQRADVGVQVEDHNQSSQLYFADHGLSFFDTRNGIGWRFNMKSNVFIEKDISPEKAANALTLSGVKPLNEVSATDYFKNIPRVEKTKYTQLVSRHNVYQYNEKSQSIALRFTVSSNEFLLSGIRLHENFASVVSNKALYLFESFEIDQDYNLLKPFAVIAIPGEWKSLARISMAELVDGYIVEYIYGRNAVNTTYETSQLVFKATLMGEVNEVSSQKLRFDYPDWMTHAGYWISPLYSYAYEIFGYFCNPHDALYMDVSRTINYRPPNRVILLLLATSLLSMGFTIFFARRAGMTTRAMCCWTLCNGVAGLPGFISFWFLSGASHSRFSQ
jgi:hypothetical protein